MGTCQRQFHPQEERYIWEVTHSQICYKSCASMPGTLLVFPRAKGRLHDVLALSTPHPPGAISEQIYTVVK